MRVAAKVSIRRPNVRHVPPPAANVPQDGGRRLAKARRPPMRRCIPTLGAAVSAAAPVRTQR